MTTWHDLNADTYAYKSHVMDNFNALADGSKTITSANIMSLTAQTASIGTAVIGTDIYTTPWATWTPTVTGGGAMTTAAVSVNYARWRKVGKSVQAELRVTFALTGVASTEVNFTVPFTPANDSTAMFHGFVTDSITMAGFGYWQAGPSVITVTRYNYGTWSLGASRRITMSGVCEVA